MFKIYYEMSALSQFYDVQGTSGFSQSQRTKLHHIEMDGSSQTYSCSTKCLLLKVLQPKVVICIHVVSCKDVVVNGINSKINTFQPSIRAFESAVPSTSGRLQFWLVCISVNEFSAVVLFCDVDVAAVYVVVVVVCVSVNLDSEALFVLL